MITAEQLPRQREEIAERAHRQASAHLTTVQRRHHLRGDARGTEMGL